MAALVLDVVRKVVGCDAQRRLSTVVCGAVEDVNFVEVAANVEAQTRK